MGRLLFVYENADVTNQGSMEREQRYLLHWGNPRKRGSMRVVYREDQQQREHEVLSDEAAFSDGSEGRRSSGEPDAPSPTTSPA